MKKVIRLTENDIHRIVKNSVKRILKEYVDDKNVKMNIFRLHIDTNNPHDEEMAKEVLSCVARKIMKKTQTKDISFNQKDCFYIYNAKIYSEFVQELNNLGEYYMLSVEVSKYDENESTWKPFKIISF